ncbi:MAG: hypothetical protein PHU85_04105 [Phycisphaerae bacterium]|nr:hypothetical protein [Phycisphaerae bacterium]
MGSERQSLSISQRLKAAQFGLDSVQGGKKGRKTAGSASQEKVANDARVKKVEQHSKAK